MQSPRQIQGPGFHFTSQTSLEQAAQGAPPHGDGRGRQRPGRSRRGRAGRGGGGTGDATPAASPAIRQIQGSGVTGGQGSTQERYAALGRKNLTVFSGTAKRGAVAGTVMPCAMCGSNNGATCGRTVDIGVPFLQKSLHGAIKLGFFSPN